MTNTEWFNLSLEAGKIFSPAAPIDRETLFAGRIEQMRKLVDVINQRGQHAIVFGERGVGKTSLAHILRTKIGVKSQNPSIGLLSPIINCDSSDSYSSLWMKVFSNIELQYQIKQLGFNSSSENLSIPLSEEFKEKGEITPDDVRKAMALLSVNNIVMVIIDEFDRVNDRQTKTLFADTIKTLSDQSIAATLVIVGVADSVDELIEEHYSIERNLVQIKIPRMSKDELHEILNKGLSLLDMTIEQKAENHIVLLSQGLPHYTHLLGLHSARKAFDSSRKAIVFGDIEQAISKAILEAQQSIKSAYHKATMSTRKGNIYAQVLLACSLTKTDDLGYFAAADVREPLSKIMRKPYDIPSFSRHLYDFCEEIRGPILNRMGKKHRYKFRFINPIMQPYITMQGFANNLISSAALEEQLMLF